ncbi:Erlin-2 [Bienertia sinuspersici]
MIIRLFSLLQGLEQAPDDIDKRMKDALQSDCTRYAPGIEIICVRVAKSTILEIIRQRYEQIKEERTKALIAIEKQRVAEKEPETLKKIVIFDAEKKSFVSKIIMEQKLKEKESARRPHQIDNEMNFSWLIKEAEANKLKLTPQYLEFGFIEGTTNKTKIYFGKR